MPQSLSKVIVHIIFSTKERKPFLEASVRPRMHAYVATICRDSGADLVHVGGVADHIHILTTLPRTVSQLEGVLRYIHRQAQHHRTRTFQEEYRELLRRHGVDFDERYMWD